MGSTNFQNAYTTTATSSRASTSVILPSPALTSPSAQSSPLAATSWPTQWQGLPYHPISHHYKQVFGEKVIKIPVSVAGSCPNRDGVSGMRVCNFCDVYGSAAYPDLQKNNLAEQIETSRKRVLMRSHAAKFLVYFQAYTTTFQKVQELRGHIEQAAQLEDVVGIVVGTRPDCISEALFELLNESAEKFYVALEFGVQSFDEKQLLWMHRGHTAERSIHAIRRTAEKCPKVNLGIHLMFGFPGETEADVIQAAHICNTLPIQNVKLHNLHVLKHTDLEKDFLAGQFLPIELAEYMQFAISFLQHLRPEIAVHRLAALSSRSDELLAPKWTAKKMEIYQGFLDRMNAEKKFQGQLCAF